MSLLLAITLAGLPAGYEGHPHLVIHLPQGWLFLTPAGEQEFIVADVDGREPISLAPVNGVGLVYTARRATGQTGLFLKRGLQVSEDISVSDGFHGQVSVDSAGKTIAFSHHPGMGMSPEADMAHGENAQLWVISLAHPDRPRKVTSSRGCKSEPAYSAGGELFYNHSTCTGYQGLEVLDKALRRTKELIPASGYVAHPLVSPDGRHLLYYRKAGRGWAVLLSDYPGIVGQRQVGELRAGEGLLSASWLSSGGRVLFASGARLMRYDLAEGRSVEIPVAVPALSDGGAL